MNAATHRPALELTDLTDSLRRPARGSSANGYYVKSLGAG